MDERDWHAYVDGVLRVVDLVELFRGGVGVVGREKARLGLERALASRSPDNLAEDLAMAIAMLDC